MTLNLNKACYVSCRILLYHKRVINDNTDDVVDESIS
jgi:hypothetical protein